MDDDFRPEVCLLAATRADAPPARARAVNEATDAEAKSARRVGAGDVIGRGALMTRRAVRTDTQISLRVRGGGGDAPGTTREGVVSLLTGKSASAHANGSVPVTPFEEASLSRMYPRRARMPARLNPMTSRASLALARRSGLSSTRHRAG